MFLHTCSFHLYRPWWFLPFDEIRSVGIEEQLPPLRRFRPSRRLAASFGLKVLHSPFELFETHPWHWGPYSYRDGSLVLAADIKTQQKEYKMMTVDSTHSFLHSSVLPQEEVFHSVHDE